MRAAVPCGKRQTPSGNPDGVSIYAQPVTQPGGDSISFGVNQLPK
jgi:hypothetical protein